mmetsp:Transcript_35968/g.57298  ORF Transcript_35968/g.57298 Transcript_35968/m.57298 type:complete len:643 (-) Transcript_35968:116-2044(-)
MDKRKFDNYGYVDEQKRYRYASEDGGLEGGFSEEDEAEFYMEQRLVGWVIGSRGATLKEIEQAYQVKVVVDQASKELGYSKVKITGPRDNWQAAAEHINQSLARATSSTDGGSAVGPFLLDSPPSAPREESIHEEMRIEQRYVGWLLGRGGGVVREIEQSSGCKISINQDTKAQGYSRAVIHGNSSERRIARDMITESLSKARDSSSPAGKASGKGGDHFHQSSRRTDDELQIEQKWVGWLLGRGGGVIKEIEQEHRVTISIDQSSKEYGYSIVKISGERFNVERGKGRIQEQLRKVGGASLEADYGASSNDQASVEVEQQWVGWLLGSRGAVMREIEQSSGAKISIDQSTKELGYSTVCITGSHHSIATARHMVLDKLAQVDPSASQHAAPVKQPARKDEAIGALVETLGLSKDLELSKVRELAQAVLEVIPENVDDAKGGGFNGGMARPSVGNHVDLTSRGRAPLQAPSRVSSPAFSREEALELQVEQKWVGWILGKGGSTMRDIEAETGAKVSIDQSTKELGYSVVKMSGSSMAVQKAQQRIQASLSHVTGKAPAAEGQAPIGVLGAAEEEMQVEQRLIGWVLGARGVVLKEIETSSGARISIDQSTKELGFSTLRISGSYDSISAARVLVSEKMLQAG